jgi:hypothetical protein
MPTLFLLFMYKKIVQVVPKPGFEPGRELPTTPSRWRVCQFHHFGSITEVFNNSQRHPCQYGNCRTLLLMNLVFEPIWISVPGQNNLRPSPMKDPRFFATTYGRSFSIDSFLKTCSYNKLQEVSQIALTGRTSITTYIDNHYQ